MVRVQLELDDLPSDVSDAWIDSLYKQVDRDHNGYIDDVRSRPAVACVMALL